MNFYCSRELSVFGLFSLNPYVNRIAFLAFCVPIYKNVSQKNCFIYMNKNYNDFQQRKITCTLIYIQFVFQTFQYPKIQTMSVTFLYTKSKTLYLTRFFMKILKLAFIYKNHDTLRHMTFYIENLDTFTKSKTICVTFFNTKIRTLCVKQFFIEFLKSAEVGGHFYMQKNSALCVKFLY